MIVTKSLQLNSDNFNFDLTPGFEMAVEKDWNVLDFTDLNDQLQIYDADLRAMNPSKYGVRIFYKACIPMNYIDPENYPDNPLIKDADNSSFTGKYLDLVDGTVIGSPVNKMYENPYEESYGEYGYHGLLIDENVAKTKTAYALPDDRALNHTNVAKWAFAGGSSLATCAVDNEYYQPMVVNDINRFAYMLMNSGGYENGGVASFIVNNGALAYSIDTGANRFNLPTDENHTSGYKYLQPALFTPFGVAFAGHLTLNGGTNVDTAGWFYCVLGVNELGGEDPDWQYDPAILRIYNDLEDMIECVEGTYNYSGTLTDENPILYIQTAEDVTITGITFNGSVVTVPERDAYNVYTTLFENAQSTNTLVITTDDPNHQVKTYTFSLAYSVSPEPEPEPEYRDPAFINIYTSNYYEGERTIGDTITGLEGVTTYTLSIDYSKLDYIRINLEDGYMWMSYSIDGVAQDTLERERDDTYFYYRIRQYQLPSTDFTMTVRIGDRSGSELHETFYTINCVMQ